MPHGPKTRRIPKEAIARRLNEDPRRKKTSSKPDGGVSGRRGTAKVNQAAEARKSPGFPWRKYGKKIIESREPAEDSPEFDWRKHGNKMRSGWKPGTFKMQNKKDRYVDLG